MGACFGDVPGTCQLVPSPGGFSCKLSLSELILRVGKSTLRLRTVRLYSIKRLLSFQETSLLFWCEPETASQTLPNYLWDSWGLSLLIGTLGMQDCGCCDLDFKQIEKGTVRQST